nr:hypothetical protein [Providencia stuartii]
MNIYYLKNEHYNLDMNKILFFLIKNIHKIKLDSYLNYYVTNLHYVYEINKEFFNKPYIKNDEIVIPNFFIDDKDFIKQLRELIKFEVTNKVNVCIVTNNIFHLQDNPERENYNRYVINNNVKEKIHTYDMEEIYFIAHKKFMTCSYKLSNMVSDILDKALYVDIEKNHNHLSREIMQLREFCSTDKQFAFLEKSQEILNSLINNEQVVKNKNNNSKKNNP